MITCFYCCCLCLLHFRPETWWESHAKYWDELEQPNRWYPVTVQDQTANTEGKTVTNDITPSLVVQPSKRTGVAWQGYITPLWFGLFAGIIGQTTGLFSRAVYILLCYCEVEAFPHYTRNCKKCSNLPYTRNFRDNCDDFINSFIYGRHFHNDFFNSSIYGRRFLQRVF